MVYPVSLTTFNQEFEERGKDFGFRASLNQAKKDDPNFNIEDQLDKIPQNYLQHLASLGLATQGSDVYEIDEAKIDQLARRFAPILTFDSRDKQVDQLGNLTSYLIALFSAQYQLVKDNPPEKYEKFVQYWKENPTEEQFLQFLNQLTDNGKNILDANFFQETLQTKELSLKAPSHPKVYLNCIPSDQNKVVMQYWMFYPKNDQNRLLGLVSKIIGCAAKIWPSLKKYQTIGAHLGDWERVDVYLEKEGDHFKKIGTTYAGHGKLNIHKTEDSSDRTVFVAQGGHATCPSSFPINLALDQCDGKGKSLNLADRDIQLIPMSLHHLLEGKSLEAKCLSLILKHGPKGSPDSMPFQKFYVEDASRLEFVRLNKAWQPNQPIIGWLWRLIHPARPDPRIPAWNP
jgi:hypothetical protein